MKTHTHIVSQDRIANHGLLISGSLRSKSYMKQRTSGRPLTLDHGCQKVFTSRGMRRSCSFRSRKFWKLPQSREIGHYEQGNKVRNRVKRSGSQFCRTAGVRDVNSEPGVVLLDLFEFLYNNNNKDEHLLQLVYWLTPTENEL